MFKTKKSRSVVTSGDEVFTSSEVSRVSGVSLRQLQWWDERGVVSPRQDGHRRVYTSQEVLEVSVIAALRQKGFSLQKIRRVLRFLAKGNGQAAFRSSRRRVRYAPADGRQTHLSRRRPWTCNRSHEERAAAHVSGVRDGSNEAAGCSRAQAGEIRNSEQR